ncbi:MAG: helix-turn-helix transcriptional regulator [Candidatus Firestonebacteria bacterium]|nr:helix-turn-helix transcriptional regulator [Candidatus Firestonebacteria bacterium]
MTENIRQVALRIKTLREISGEKPEALAAVLGVSADEYRRYESGEADIPVSLLYEIAGHFKVELTALLTGEEPRLHHYSLVRAGKGPSVERRKEYAYQDLAYNFIHKRMETFLVTVEPRAGEAPGHFNSHPGQEFNHCLEGTLKVCFEKSEVVLNPGDSLYFDSGQGHAMVALEGKPARFLAVIL